MSAIVASPRLVLAAAVLAIGIDVAITLGLGWSPALPAYLLFGVAAAIVTVTDLVERRIPNRVVGPAAGTLSLLGLAAGVSGDPWPLARAAVAMVALAGFYVLLSLAFPGGMGMGDAKWAGMVGRVLGYLGWAAVADATLLGFASAALFVLARRLAAPRLGRATVPMAPFMVVGAIAAVLAPR
jgi:leader peptidase (prepilin peptidase)/N-methyltransferase